MFLKDFSILALHLKHYGKTNFLEFVIHKKRSENRNVEYKLENEVGQIKITFATNLEGDPAEIVKKKRQKVYLISTCNTQHMSQENHQNHEKNQDQEKHLEQERLKDQEKRKEQEKIGEEDKFGEQEKVKEQMNVEEQEKVRESRSRKASRTRETQRSRETGGTG